MKNFDDYPEFLSRKQFMDLTEWSSSKVWRLTREGGKLAHIKKTSLGKDCPPLFDKNKLYRFIKYGNKQSQVKLEILSTYKARRYDSSSSGPFNNGNGSGQPEGIYKPKEDPKKPTGHDKNGDKGGQSKDLNKSYSPDKNGNGGDDHGQSL